MTQDEKMLEMRHIIELALVFGSAAELLLGKSLKECEVWNENHPDQPIRFRQEQKMYWNRYNQAAKALRARYMDLLEYVLGGGSAEELFATIIARQDAAICFVAFWLNACNTGDKETNLAKAKEMYDYMHKQSYDAENKIFSHQFLNSLMGKI